MFKTMNKKVIITGATGMVGSIILDLCLKSDHVQEVISLVRRLSDKKVTKLNVPRQVRRRYEHVIGLFPAIKWNFDGLLSISVKLSFRQKIWYSSVTKYAQKAALLT